MLNRSEVLSELLSRKAGHALSRSLYTDPGVFQVDMEQIWYKNWLFAIPACEVPKKGNFVTFDIGQYSVIIVRGNDDEVRAFHNSCRHRGSVLCTASKGSRPKIVCPYHQWTYELDGRLLWARDMGKDFDASKWGLKPVHCRNVSGLIYICLAETAPSIEEMERTARAYMGHHDLTNSKIAFESTIVEKGNWKLVWENNRECYHCAGNHPALCRTFPEDPALIGNNAEDGTVEEFNEYVEKMKGEGAPVAYKAADDGTWRFVRTALVGNGESYTMDGKIAVAKPNSSFPFRDAGVLLKFAYPASWQHYLSDHALVFRLTPLSPTETEVTTKWLVHKDAVEGVDYDLKRLTEVWIATNDEDRMVVENNQKGILSPAYEPGPYSPSQEGGLMQFVDWYSDTLSRGLIGRTLMAAE